MIPFLRPAPPSLRTLQAELLDIEQSGIFTNYGPVNARFEAALEHAMFPGGICVTVCNATIGLMMAIRAVVERADAQGGGTSGRSRGRGPDQVSGRRYALMPSFTFAAAAHAADWAGLTPLFCDIDESDWSASEAAEEAMIERYGSEIAVIVPYATFGNCIDLARYERLSSRTGIPVVVDAAASLGSLDQQGLPFGAGCRFPIVFSMHVTKTFSTAEGGVIHCADPELAAMLRTMGNFGFGEPRSATMPGLNSKLSEIGALLALSRLADFESVVRHRDALAARYRALLPNWVFQEIRGQRCAHQFMPVLLPPDLGCRRDQILAALGARGIGVAAYFSPHVAEQPFFSSRGVAGGLTVTERVSACILALPLWDGMTVDLVATVCRELVEVCRLTSAPLGRARLVPSLRMQPADGGLTRQPKPAPAAPMPAGPRTPQVVPQASALQGPGRQEPLPRAQAS